MNPPPDTRLEALLRERAGRLAAPDAAWRTDILAAAAAEPAERRSPSRRMLVWGSLAACWLAVLLLNNATSELTARHQTPGLSAPQPDAALLFACPENFLTLLQPAPRPPAPPPRPPHQSWSVPALRFPDGRA